MKSLERQVSRELQVPQRTKNIVDRDDDSQFHCDQKAGPQTRRPYSTVGAQLPSYTSCNDIAGAYVYYLLSFRLIAPIFPYSV